MMPNETLLKAISWTLVHSVWQGLILAVLAGLVILFTKKSTSVLRYNLLAGLFVSFMIAVGFTFSYEFQEEGRETITRLNLPIENQNFAVAGAIPEEKADLSMQIINFLNENSSLIVLIWFLIFSVKCLNIFSNLNHIYRIRNYRIQNPPQYWSDRVSQLSKTLNIKKPIVLLESQLVKVPSVTGFFKPIILIPVGLLSNLPQDQIEAILLHELAHIRRKDYFINLIQSFAEIIFFFNPGVLWLSSLLKEERENCCDDIAVGITKSKSKFIHALVSFQEYNMKQNQLAMGFGGRKNQLLERAKRIIHDNNKSLNSIEKTFLSICFIIVAVFMIACSNTKSTVANTEALPETAVPFDNTRPATEEELIAYNEALSEAEVDKIEAERAIKEAEQLQIESEQERIVAEQEKIEAEREKIEEDEEKEEIGNLRIEVPVQVKVSNKVEPLAPNNYRIDSEKARIEGEKARIEGAKARVEGEKARIEGAKAAAEGAKARVEGAKARIEGAKAAIEGAKARAEGDKARIEGAKARIAGEKAKLEAQKAVLEAQKAKVDADLKKLESKLEKEKYKNGLGSSVYTKETATNTNGNKSKNKTVIYGDVIPEGVDNISHEIIETLIAENVIYNVENLSYKLSRADFIVNGKSISDKVHDKLKKYLKPNISAVYYNYEVSSAQDAKNKK
ncbi:M56 family metallopeptidase [uncultured Flavobacterium sp.]|uniref:M56 family metallopeptidase n=1 Tax=uncultured Flavobacterium sp. TaxID=165435 RepID=UPI0025D9B9BC|nr:M56 family metallopeptidase [uncultured Flavobacterium sp.]